MVARLLKDNGFRVALIDDDPDRFAALRTEGFVGFHGDALRPDLLTAAGAEEIGASGPRESGRVA